MFGDILTISAGCKGGDLKNVDDSFILSLFIAHLPLLCISQLAVKVKLELVYATDITKGQAVGSAFEVASSDLRRLEEAGLLLRRQIKKAHEDSPTMPWPPTAAFLQTDTIQPPVLLQEFLTVLITGKRNDSSERSKRHTGSLAQDICYTVARGQWTMPKHLLLGMSLRHQGVRK